MGQSHYHDCSRAVFYRIACSCQLKSQTSKQTDLWNGKKNAAGWRVWRVRKQRRGSPRELLQHRQRAEAPFLSPTQNSCWYPDIYMGLHEHMVSLLSTTSQGVLCPTGPHGAGVAALGNGCLHFLLFWYTLSILYRKAWWMHTPSSPHCLWHLQISSLRFALHFPS